MEMPFVKVSSRKSIMRFNGGPERADFGTGTSFSVVSPASAVPVPSEVTPGTVSFGLGSV
jgi:hypothetical protein